MASITEYRPGIFRAVVRRVGYPVKSKTFTDERLASLWAAGEEARMGVSEYDRLQIKAASVMLVSDLFEKYRDEVAVHMKGRNEKGTVERLIRDAAFMKLRLDRLKSTDIRDWRDARVKEIQPQSVHRELNTISGVFTHAMKEWSAPLPANPAHNVSRFKNADKSREMRWNQADTQKLLKVAGWKEDKRPTTGRDYVGWGLLLGIETAMRIGELCVLKASDFYPKRAYVHLAETKNGDARDVPLSKKAVKWLKFLCEDRRPGDKIIPITANTLGEYMLDARRLAGLEHLVFHDSRHEAATRLSKKLSNVLELSAVTGHRSLKSLKKYYHPDATDLARKLG